MLKGGGMSVRRATSFEALVDPISFEALVRKVARCRRCEEMTYSHVLGAANGELEACVLIVGEAPEWLGAARTGAPFSGD